MRDTVLTEMGFKCIKEWNDEKSQKALFLHPKKTIPVTVSISKGYHGVDERHYSAHFQINATEYAEEYEGNMPRASSTPIILRNGDCIQDCFVESSFQTPFEQDRALSRLWWGNNLLKTWVTKDDLWLDSSKEVGEIIKTEVKRIVIVPSRPVLDKEELPVEEVLKLSGLIPKKEENFSITGSGKSKRYWVQGEIGKVCSYRTKNIEVAKQKATEEQILMRAALKLEASMFERNSREYDQWGYISFYLPGQAIGSALDKEPCHMKLNKQLDAIELYEGSSERDNEAPIAKFPMKDFIRELPKACETQLLAEVELA